MEEGEEALPGRALVWAPRRGCACPWHTGRTSALLRRGCRLPFRDLGVGPTSPGRPTGDV